MTLPTKTLDPNILTVFKLIRPFLALDYVFMTYCTLYAYKTYGLAGSLWYAVIQYSISLVGSLGVYQLAFRLNLNIADLYKKGFLGFFWGFTVLALLVFEGTEPLWVASGGALLGLLRGGMWGCRHWMELTRTSGVPRQKYVMLIQSWTSLSKVGVPLLVAGSLEALSGWTLAANQDFVWLYVAGALLAAWGYLSNKNTTIEELPVPDKPNAFKTFVQPEFWDTAFFYLYQGAGQSLRTALYISGIMMVVSSVKAFSGLDALFSALSALVVMYGVSKVKKDNVSTVTLKVSMGTMALSWIVFLASLHWNWALPVFIIMYAVITPFLNTVSSSLVLKGLSCPSALPHNNIMAREILQTLARISGLGIAYLLSNCPLDPVWSTTLVVLFMLGLMPFEYKAATKLKNQKI